MWSSLHCAIWSRLRSGLLPLVPLPGDGVQPVSFVRVIQRSHDYHINLGLQRWTGSLFRVLVHVRDLNGHCFRGGRISLRRRMPES